MASSAHAEIKLRGVSWQFAKPGPGRRFNDIQQLVLVGPKLKGKVRARLRIYNPDGKVEEGILVRYSLVAKLSQPGGTWRGWALPFFLDQRQIPRLKAGGVREIPLDPTVGIKLYLKKVARWGFQVDEIKIRVMLEPRRDEKNPIQILENTLRVTF